MLTNLDELETSLEAPIEESVNPILAFRRPNHRDADERSFLTPTVGQRVYLPIRRVIDFTLALVLTLIAVPIVLMAALAVPFGFMVGNRGAMTAVGVSLGIALSYLAVNTLFEKLGNVNQLPPTMAAWSPDVVFGLVGLYFLLRMRS